jgi:tetratricopeptide (TPR) repeat protein
MTEPSDPAHPLLAPIARAPWRRTHGFGWVALIAVLAMKFVVCRSHDPDCATAAQASSNAVTVVVCEREYTRTGDPATGGRLADAYLRAGNREVAVAIADGLLVTTARAPALRVLGRAALAEHHPEAGMAEFKRALDVDRANANHEGIARDQQAISSVLIERYQHAQALRALDEAISEAHLAGNDVLEGYCHLSAAHVLFQAGSFEVSELEIGHAEEHFQTGHLHERMLIEYEHGNLSQERARNPLDDGLPREEEIRHFRLMKKYAEELQDPPYVLSAELNLAYSVAHAGRPDEANEYLVAADQLDRSNMLQVERNQRRAQIAFGRGDLAGAKQLYDALYELINKDATHDDHDDRYDICVMSTRVAIASHDLARAELWAMRGIEEVEHALDEQTSVEYRGWTQSTHREPYELLFEIRALQHRNVETLEVFDQWQGRTLFDALSRPTLSPKLDLRGVAAQIESLTSWLPATAHVPLLQPSTEHLAPATIQSTDLLVLVAADHAVWRVTALDGQIDVVRLGSIESFRQPFLDFRTNPTATRLAEQLGRQLVPEAMFRTTPRPLRVMLDGPLMSLPIVALRHAGQPLIAFRPVIYAPRLSELACAPPRPAPQRATVIADANDNLKATHEYASKLARTLHTAEAFFGTDATTAVLFGATQSDLLHIAVHGDTDTIGDFLQLADRKLYTLEILSHHIAPPLVVLSACTSAISSKSELAGSLAMAFLAGGSTQVVATLRPVSDRGARDVMSKFYDLGGDRDPVRALDKAQAELARGDNVDWPNFAVFGRDLCTH